MCAYRQEAIRIDEDLWHGKTETDEATCHMDKCLQTCGMHQNVFQGQHDYGTSRYMKIDVYANGSLAAWATRLVLIYAYMEISISRYGASWRSVDICGPHNDTGEST